MRKIFLYGPPGSGKSTLGKLLAAALNLPFVDIDSEIEAAAGMSIPEIMRIEGETGFRERESAAIRRLADTHFSEVVALGGGALLRRENRSFVESAGDVVFLDADPRMLLERVASGSEQRPLLKGNAREKLLALLEKRSDHYRSFKMRVVINIQTNSSLSKKPEAIIQEIQQLLGRFYVTGMGQGYGVIVESGGVDRLGALLSELQVSSHVMVVCDQNVAELHLDHVMAVLTAADFTAHKLVIPAGEEYKTIETVSRLWTGFLAAGLDRKSTVIALGGGVVGDLTGFAAASFMRGCQWVVVPTTLLSMVDASMGGKTGFDLPEGKNLIGAFHPPQLVLADPSLLKSLPEAEFLSGMAEVIKHGIISDPALFDLCSNGIEAIKGDLTNIVRRAMAVKIQIIKTDPFEKGLRAALNLGHTIGHAVEIASHYKLRHGEAVAIGIVAEARLAEKIGMTEYISGVSEKIISTLSKIGLPTEIPPDLEKSAIIQAMRVDKKKDGKAIKFALPLDIGNVQINVAISDLESVL